LFFQAFWTSVTCHGDLISKMARARRQAKYMAFDLSSFSPLPPLAGDTTVKLQPSLKAKLFRNVNRQTMPCTPRSKVTH